MGKGQRMGATKLTKKAAKEMLEGLVPEYVTHKKEFDTLKKTVDNENGQIKNIMAEAKLDTFTVEGKGGVSYTESCRKSMDEVKLLEYLQDKKYHKAFCDAGVIVTKEVIDSDSLEKLLYNMDSQSKPVQEALKNLDKFITVKKVPTLRTI